MAAGILHGKMTHDALGALGWDIDQIKKIVGHASGVDNSFRHGRGSCHRVGKYQGEFESYGGRVCDFLGAERNAAEFLAKAEEARLAGDEDGVLKHLGYSVHFIQDALCPEHIFPFQENILIAPFEAHMNFMLYVTWVYSRRNWPNLVRNAPAILISNPDDLCREIEGAADLVWALPCSYRRIDGEKIIDPRVGKFSFLRGWKMEDEWIGKCLEKAASLAKGAAVFLNKVVRPEGKNS